MIVSNTTPIVCFLKLGRLDILKNIFNEIIISQAVYAEVTAKPDEAEAITALTESGLFKTRPVENKFAVSLLQKQIGLDLGESESIVLAQELKAELLLMDERKGRRVAAENGISISGTLDVLIKAKQMNLVKEIRPLLNELITKDIRIGNNLLKKVLESVNENE
jgi:predicted nucleic acid-binding protein